MTDSKFSGQIISINNNTAVISGSKIWLSHFLPDCKVLKYAVKYFKAASKAAVSNNWHSRESDSEYWKQAVIKLKKAIEPLSAD